jgi:hypothetical protein
LYTGDKTGHHRELGRICRKQEFRIKPIENQTEAAIDKYPARRPLRRQNVREYL